MVCIWCLHPASDRDLEHVFPEALGCPPHFTLPGTVVCKRCNNQLAHLDRAVADEFDFLVLLKGVRRKKGRLPEVHSRGNVHGTCESGGPALSFNMEKHPVKSHTGKRLAAYRGGERDVPVKFERLGPFALANFQVAFGQGPKFVRGIAKIAFSAFAMICGAEKARSAEFDALRAFVVNGDGVRRTLVSAAEDSTYRLAATPYEAIDGVPSVLMDIRIACIHFLIDLSPTESRLAEVREMLSKTSGDQGWTVLPTGS